MTGRLELVTLVVDDYDRAISFFCGGLGFDLVTDEPSMTNDGRPKRWVVVRPAEGGTALLLAKADGAAQEAVVGNQTGGRVGFFLRVPDVDASMADVIAAGGQALGEPRNEEYGRVVVIVDLWGNRWDLLGDP